ncbi:MAG TPA: response regulator [Patescibacteria group bacterium]|nr:response regulator [Patescibacteria group bacterium]
MGMDDARILVVDDDESIRRVFKINLEEEGYTVETAVSGDEALSKIKNSYFNLVFLDVKLGDIEGTDLLKMIDEMRPKMRKIIVTGYPSLENAIQALNRGADGYLLKPVKIEKLLKVLKEQLEKQREESEFDEKKMSSYLEDRVNELELMKRYYRPIGESRSE